MRNFIIPAAFVFLPFVCEAPPEVGGSGGDGDPVVDAPLFVELEDENFQGEVEGVATDLYTISNASGMVVKITNLGAKIEQILVPDRDGVFADVVLGYESLATVQTGQPSMGAFMGRYANRIGGTTFTVDGVEFTGGRFELDGNVYTIAANSGINTLHGGARGARFRPFIANQRSESSVEMRLTFDAFEDAVPPGFTGFPGTLELVVVYTVTDDFELKVGYTATVSGEDTVVNFTSHPFFNLSNTPGSVVTDHELTINADRFVELNANLIPTGVLRDVAGTPMDFRVEKPIGQDIGDTSYDMIALIEPNLGGYDHTFALNQRAPAKRTLAATVYEPTSGRTLEIWSTEPGVQLFTADGLDGTAPRNVGKGGVPYIRRSAFCLEPMHFPDSPNQPTFPSTTLEVGEIYTGEIIFRFGTRD